MLVCFRFKTRTMLNMHDASNSTLPSCYEQSECRILSVLKKQWRVVSRERKVKDVIDSIVTGGKTTVLYYDPFSKREFMDSHRPWSPLLIKARMISKKIISLSYLESKGILLVDFKERNTAVTCARKCVSLHCNLLFSKVVSRN